MIFFFFFFLNWKNYQILKYVTTPRKKVDKEQNTYFW